MIKTKAWLFLSCLLSAFICSFAHSQNYPSKAIRLVVPYAPGGGLDVFNRPMSIKLSELISQPVVIDNKAGASGVIGADVVAKSPADGYTLLTAFSSQILQPFVLKNVPFDNQKDFTPILEAARAPIVIVVNPSLPVYSMAELINYAKNNPGKVGYVTAGTNTSQHLTGLMLEKITGTPLIHISYTGGGPALTDLLGPQERKPRPTCPRLRRLALAEQPCQTHGLAILGPKDSQARKQNKSML